MLHLEFFWCSPWLSVPGLDWSEDSADDVDDDADEDEAGAFIPFQNSWRPRNGSVSYHASPLPYYRPAGSFLLWFLWTFCLNRLEDDDSSSRKTRLLRLCSYLQHKYKHMCRQERASIRQKKYRYAFRKALLHAASNNPDSAGQLIQELRGASRRWSRYCHKCPHLRHIRDKNVSVLVCSV